jgi:peptidoglycan hydrolase-like protein with peptidoglycan-binding domain
VVPPRPRTSLWLPAKIGVAGALCTYLALTFAPALLERPATQVPGSDLADTRAPAQTEEGQVRLAQFRPDALSPEPAEAAAPAVAETQPDTALPPRELEAALPPQRPGVNEAPQRDLALAEHAEEVQRRLTRYGYLPAAPTGVWGSMSRQALRAFKAAHDLGQDDSWDQATERALFGTNVKTADSFVGIWGADANACSPQGGRKGLLPAVIDNHGAMAGETTCAFKDRVKTLEGWTFTATCTSPRERWTTKVRLETNGNKLVWASQRGTQTYTRCERRLITADMTTSRSR